MEFFSKACRRKMGVWQGAREEVSICNHLLQSSGSLALGGCTLFIKRYNH